MTRFHVPARFELFNLLRVLVPDELLECLLQLIPFVRSDVLVQSLHVKHTGFLVEAVHPAYGYVFGHLLFLEVLLLDVFAQVGELLK